MRLLRTATLVVVRAFKELETERRGRARGVMGGMGKGYTPHSSLLNLLSSFGLVATFASCNPTPAPALASVWPKGLPVSRWSANGSPSLLAGESIAVAGGLEVSGVEGSIPVWMRGKLRTSSMPGLVAPCG